MREGENSGIRMTVEVQHQVQVAQNNPLWVDAWFRSVILLNMSVFCIYGHSWSHIIYPPVPAGNPARD